MKKHLTLIYILFLIGIETGNAQYRVLYNFTDSTGSHPEGSLTPCGNLFFATTTYGGAYGYGCIFSIDSNGDNYKDKFDFNGGNVNEASTLILSGNMLYGLSDLGGSKNFGCIFSIDTSGGSFKDLFNFNDTDGAYPYGSLTISGGILYGMAAHGGLNNYGCIFSIDTTGVGFKDLYNFNGSQGEIPFGTLLISGNVLYGMAVAGGANNDGCIFKINTNGSGYIDMFNFNDTNGNMPLNSALTLSGNKLYGTTPYGGLSGIGVVFSIDTNGSGYKILHNFNRTDGSGPNSTLIFSKNKLYGTTDWGGANNWGSIFCIDTNGSEFRNLFYFDKTNGGNPNGTLLLSGNLLYGLTEYGGSAFDSGGVMFRLDTSSILSVNTIKQPSAIINIFPNPNNGQFTLSLLNANTVYNVEIYNILGEKVYSQFKIQSPTFDIDMSNQPNGVYFYRVISASRKLVGEGKVIIQK